MRWMTDRLMSVIIDHCTLESLLSLTMVPLLAVVVIANKGLEMLGSAQSGLSQHMA